MYTASGNEAGEICPIIIGGEMVIFKKENNNNNNNAPIR